MKPERLSQLAGAVADGTPVAWNEVDEDSGEADRPVVEALRLVDAVARLSGGRPEDGSQDAAAPPPRFRHLEILGPLGEGTSGAVFRARDTRLDREVALKLIPAGRADRAGEAIREGQLLARIRHPNVATVFGADEEDGRVGLWMELVHGRTLREGVEDDGPRSAREAAAIGLDLCRALAAVHAAGLLHRDVKAQNVLREDGGRIVLADFGIGLEGGDDDRGRLRGTPAYLAPEVLAGGRPSVRSDLYALGVLLYYLATARLPVAGRSLDELEAAHRAGQRVPLRDLRPDLPEAFVAAVERAMAADPAARFGSAGELERALAAVLGPARGGGRLPALLAVATLLAAALAAGALFVARRPQRQAERLVAQARQLYAEERTEEAAAMLEAALELDPEHALALRQLSICQNALGLFEQALGSASRAYALRERADARDAARIEGSYHFGRLEYEKALEAYRRAILLEPTDAESRRQVAHLHAQLGDLPAAIAAARTARDADPASVHTEGLLILLLAQAGRFDEALAEVAATRDALAPGYYLHWGEGLAWLGKGDFPRARAAFDALAEGQESYANYARLYQAQTLVVEGRIEEAIHALDDQRGTDSRRGLQWSAALRREWLARLHLVVERPREALEELAEVDSLPEIPTHLKNFRRAGVLRAELGDAGGAGRLLDRLERLRRAYPSTVSEGAAAHLRGALALARGEEDVARRELAEARRLLGDLAAVLALAGVEARRGQHGEAARLYEDALSRQGEALRQEPASSWVLAFLELARCRGRANDPRGARAAYDRFLAHWSDPRLPPVAAALAERSALDD